MILSSIVARFRRKRVMVWGETGSGSSVLCLRPACTCVLYNGGGPDDPAMHSLDCDAYQWLSDEWNKRWGDLK